MSERSVIKWLRSLTPLGVRVLIGLVTVIALALAAWWIIATFMSGKTAKTQARLSENQAEASLESGTDAVETVGRTIEYERHVDYITKETERAIREAPGADAPVDPRLDSIARQRLCQRAAYSQHPDCLQYAPAE